MNNLINAFEDNMAHRAVICLRCLGSFVFFALMAIQCGFLVSFAAKYKDEPLWYLAALFYVPSLLFWIGAFCRRKADLRRFFIVWALYMWLGLFPNTVIIFGFVVDDIKEESPLTPQALKIVLCITPLLLLLLVNTAKDSYSSDNKELVAKLSVQMAIDLFDAVEMLDIILDEKEHKFNISKGYEIAMICVVCISFCLSPWQMAENKVSRWSEPKTRYKTSLLRNVVEMFGVNAAFLVIRVLVFVNYGKDETIFIAKNVIAIILSVLEVVHLCVSH